MTENSEIANKGFLVILAGVEDVVGKNGMAAVLRQANLVQYVNHYPPSDMAYGGHQLCYMSQINHALFDIYGPRGARAILQRVGRGRWKSALEENATLAHATKMAVKLLPRRLQMRIALDTAARTYNEQLNAAVKIVEEGDQFSWQDHKCGNCMNWHSNSPVCYTTAGFVHGLVAWAVDSEALKVEEVACCAKGDAVCRHRIILL